MSSTNDVEADDAELLKQIENLKKGSGDGEEESPKETKEELKGKAGVRRSRPRKDTRSDAERMREWEENQEKKNQNVIETGLKGTVKWYSVRGHYGFIARDDGKGDIFVHQSAIWKSPTEKFYFRSLADNQPVEFNIVQGEKGLEATHVTGPNASEVKEAPRQFRRFRPFRNGYRKNKNNNGEDGESKRSVSKSEGNGDGTADEDKSGKPRRRTRKFFRRRPRGNVDENAGDQEGKAGRRRRRRGKSESANSAKAGEVGQEKETGEDAILVDTKA